MPSTKAWKKYTALFGILFLFPLFWVLFFGVFTTHHFKSLPYFGPGSLTGSDTTSYKIPKFAFTNQNGELFSSDSLRDKVWIAAFYSLSDAQAPRITERLLNVNWKYRDEEDIAIICFSTNTANDSPEVLKPYVVQNTRYNSFPGKWQFLTGPKEEMDAFIRDGFFISDIHSEAIFRLVDGQGKIRGLYGNTEYHMRNAAEDIALLKKEIDQVKFNETHSKKQTR